VKTLSITLPVGRTLQLSILATYADNSTSDNSTHYPAVTWSSSNADSVTVNNNGLVTAIGVTNSAVFVTATSGVVSGSTQVTVIPAVNLWLDPPKQTINAADNFTVKIQAQCGSQTADNITAFLTFDHTQLAVNSIDNGTTLGTTLINVFDNTTGTIEYRATSTSAQGGNFTVATIHFKNIGIVDHAAVDFMTTTDKMTTVLKDNVTDVMGTLTGGVYSVAPSIANISPASSASGVPVNASIVLTFSTAMNQTATQNSFGLSLVAGGTFSWSVDGKTMTFTPSSNLPTVPTIRLV